MPKSRGRRAKPGSQSRARRPTQPRDQYHPGVVEIDEQEGFAVITRLSPSQLLPLGLPIWRLLLTPGFPANLCLDASLVLQTAFDVYGIRAEPKVVTLTVHDRETGKTTQFGSDQPRFNRGQFNGHMGLWLPETGRFIDHSVQQFPQVRREGWLPIVAQQPAGIVGGGIEFAVPRGRLMLEYVTAPDNRTAAVLDHPTLRDAAGQHHRAGMNLASNFLDLLRSDDLLDKTFATPHPRLHGLVRALAGATSHIDEEQNYRFTLPGATTSLYLDDIEPIVPPPAKRQPETTTAPAPTTTDAELTPAPRRGWRRFWPST